MQSVLAARTLESPVVVRRLGKLDTKESQIKTARSIRRYVGQCIPFVSAAIVVVGGIWAVNTELRKEAAIATYSTYLEALILRASEEAGLAHKDHKNRSLAAARFLLYADDEVIKEAASLYLGRRNQDGGFVPTVFPCHDRSIRGMQQMYGVLLSMRKDVGTSGNFSFKEYRAVFCNVWPK